MKDVSKPSTLFEFRGKLYQTIGYADGRTVSIGPVRESDYQKCEAKIGHLVYKTHKVADLYHDTCGEFARGNGSYAMPYRCSCGSWEFDPDTCDYVLAPPKQEE